MTYVVITFIVLLFLNVYCAETSKQIFSGSKQTAMLEKAALTASEIESLEILTRGNVEVALARIGNINADRLIVTDAACRIVYDSAGQVGSYALLPQILSALRGTDTFTWHYHDGQIRAEAAIPIDSFDSICGCVYIAEYDFEQGRLITSLQKNIFIITLVLEVLVVVFSVIYAKNFSGRLRRLMRSMHFIQDGDFTQQVDLGGHDELTFLGQEFNDLSARLQESEMKRHRFVSDASHELKTPLASIKLLSDSILQYDMDMDTVREFVADIGNEAERLNRMTQKLLTLTKGEQAVESEEKEIIYLGPTMERVVRMLSGIAESARVLIHLQIRRDVCVLIQEDDLYQIVFNLVENGIKYNVPDGHLYLTLCRENDMAVLRIRDTGVGIPQEAQAHIFERFYRVDKARSRQTGGSGLGLSIVWSMVQRNGGNIRLKSEPGVGTEFTLEFPAFDVEEAES